MPDKTLNIFEDDTDESSEEFMAHEAVISALLSAATSRASSLRDVFLQQGITPAKLVAVVEADPDLSVLSHSITNMSNFFPNAKAVSPGGPEFFTREMEWVPQVLNGTRKTPFSRIKSSYADLTPDAARASGYVTGAQKVEEVIEAFQRETTPKTVYKLQKLDRDNILDITEFDVVVWLKQEMRMMLQEEVARAILISDGRAGGDPEKITEANLRPIYNDVATYTLKATLNDVGDLKDYDAMTDDELIALIDFIADAMKDYRGAGSPVFYCQPGLAVKFMLIRDADKHRLHRSTQELAAALGVSRIVQVPPMAAMERTGVVDPPLLPTGTYTIGTLGVVVNLRDYVIGMDRGGQTAFFDDFDIDFNKYSYLYETRLSGALVQPSSAIAVELVTAFV